MKYWEVLLTEWRKVGRDGFTIPFIIGSQKFIPYPHVEQNIEELITDIILHSSTKVCLKYCLTIEDIILQTLDGKKNLIGHYPDFKKTSQSTLFLTAFCDDLGKDCEQVVESLINRYHDFITHGEFSKNDRKRGDYTSAEKMFITNCFNSTLKNG